MPSKIGSESTQYKKHLTELVGDKKLSKAETDQLLKELKAPGFTQVKEFYLAGFVARNQDLFEPGDAQRLNAALKKAHPVIEPEVGKPKAGTGEPGLTLSDARAGTVSYQKVDGQLSVGGMGLDDPMQGQIGDCYFVSSLSALAATHPELLAKNLKTNRDGTYSVTFYQRADMNGPAKPVTVTVDGQFPKKGSSLEYITARDQKELWPLVYEKAYAQWKGSYGNIESGMGAMALEALTGKKPGYFPITSDMGADALFAQVKTACANKGAVVALSQPFGSDIRGMVDDHAYTLLGTVEKDGQKLVQLRNPWGSNEPGSDGKDDGVFTLTAEQFKHAFSMVEFVKP